MLKLYIEITVDVAVAYGAYYLFGWIGLSLWALFVISWFLVQVISNQSAAIKNQALILARLPERCAFCHREILDEGGTFDDVGIYHEACIEKLESLEELRKEAGVPFSEAIHRPRPSKKSAGG